MLGVIVMFALFILVALFAVTNQNVPDAILQVRFYTWGTYQATVAPWLLVFISLFVGAVVTFLASHGREMGLHRRVREKEAELQDTKAHLRRVEDALLELVPRRVEEPAAETYEEERPPEEVG
jgi:uncharacterized integral membrane protein